MKENCRTMKVSIPKGFRDFSPEVMAKRNYIFDTIRKSFQLYGFEQIETPTMENRETLTGKYGEEGDRLIFKVLERGDKLKKNVEHLISEINKGIREKDLKGETKTSVLMKIL
ncbi:MAG: histidyl-tRNA synthetase, partial [Vicingaceae bacterium]